MLSVARKYVKKYINQAETKQTKDAPYESSLVALCKRYTPFVSL